MADRVIAPAAQVDTADQVKTLSNPLRLRILRLASGPVSARHIAERLGVPITRLYYHLDLLEEAGFIEVVDIRKSGAQLERLYRRTADRFEPSERFVESALQDEGGAALLAGVIAEPARVEIQSLIEARSSGAGWAGDATRAILRLTPELAAEYLERSAAFIQEFIDRARKTPDDAETYALTHVFAPLDRAQLPPS